MSIICATSEKGGSGKTTVVTNLAVYFASLGKSVVIVDLDPQQSVSAWHGMRQDQEDIHEGIQVLSLERLLEGVKAGDQVDLREVVKRAQSKWDMVLIDVPGTDNAWQRQALLSADVAVMPIVADGFDHLTATSSFDVIEQAQVYRAEEQGWEPLQAYVLFNRAYARSTAVREAKQVYRDYVTHIEVLDEEFTDLSDYRAAASQGLGAIEWNSKNKAAKEVRRVGRLLANL
jgi:chromosome partitioning protein